MDLFYKDSPTPLAERMRPQDLSEIYGQAHLLEQKSALKVMLDENRIGSFLLWGPPGVGKTTLARLIAAQSNLLFQQISAVFSGVADLRKIFVQAQTARDKHVGTMLFIDEIHRFNRAQQDSLLPFVEDGTVIFAGATTENPGFEINSALLSRLHVFVLNALDIDALGKIAARTETLTGRTLPLTDEARAAWLAMANGDARFLLNSAEVLLNLPPEPLLDEAALQELHRRAVPLYDKNQDSHYHLISALHKSVRGSDCDAALYWAARMLDGGEDPLYILRRLTRFAYEDIGTADPQAAVQALNAWECYRKLGSPEGEIALFHLVIYLSLAPKSNAVYRAQKQAMSFAQTHASLTPPKHILNAPTAFAKSLGHGKDYRYDHDQQDGFSGQNYFPDSVEREIFYQPSPRGFEREMQKRLDYFTNLRKKRTSS